MKPRVHHFRKDEAKILKSFSIQSEHFGHIAGVSNIVRDFIDGIKKNKPPKPRHYLHQEYPCTLRGVADNFDASADTNDDNFGIIHLVQAAQDEEEKFYIRFETGKDFYYVPLR